MKKTFTLFAAGFLALSIAACARPKPPEVDLTPPPKKAYDAKTQLESGRKR